MQPRTILILDAMDVTGSDGHSVRSSRCVFEFFRIVCGCGKTGAVVNGGHRDCLMVVDQPVRSVRGKKCRKEEEEKEGQVTRGPVSTNPPVEGKPGEAVQLRPCAVARVCVSLFKTL